MSGIDLREHDAIPLAPPVQGACRDASGVATSRARLVEARALRARTGQVVLELSLDHGDGFDLGSTERSRGRRSGYVVTSPASWKVDERGARAVTQRDL